ncbi:hypothetical protein EJ06DRAFT_35751 [Trichodelitschia bisporula]|uniref:Integral membrane protein S linking to the trans Golgi network-domain-containing protein n=1 Tax=Trichodelitschia bisporula TaxID=703511 RepID=A0A6G1HUY9_9PEZI|nr:hypothetical protein EJ06DRAFT_35751 [Trichodelitschia bisporula]
MPRKRRPPRPGALADLAPLRILSQILVLQLAYYVSATVLIVFTALVAGKDLKLGLLFDWQTIRSDTTAGWMLGLVWMLNSVVGAVLILLIVARSKLVLDFAVTLHFFHLIITSLYTRSIPYWSFWWALQVTSAGTMTSLGMWACRWRELRPISFGGTPRSAESSSAQAAPESEEDGVGVGRGRGRGRGRDGGGTYEMVGMGDAGESV